MTDLVTSARHRAGVRGSPIEHSLSPVLHRAAYAALGLTDWSYDRVEVRQDEFVAHVAGLDGSWRGLSLTMPLKEVAFEVVHRASEPAETVGAINTLVRDEDDWVGHNTDIVGILEAIHAVRPEPTTAAVLIGAGATARSALAALRQLGATRVWFMVRDGVRPQSAALADSLGLSVETLRMGQWPYGADTIIGTIPARAYAGLLGALPSAPQVAGGAVVLDCVYGDGPSPLLGVAAESGYRCVSGLSMLAHQAAAQVELMTGRSAPLRAMRAALAAQVQGCVAIGGDG